MAYVIACRGEEREMLVDGTATRVMPFVGADGGGEFAQLGIGLMIGDSGTFWGLAVPHELIICWRALQILTRLQHIQSSGPELCACYYAARARESAASGDREGVESLAAQFGGMRAFEALRTEILNSAPSSELLDEMIRILHEHRVFVDSRELETEIGQGRIVATDMTRAVQEANRAWLDMIQDRRREAEAPMPPTESLGTFFKDLGIDNCIDGFTGGGYGIDWGHVELDKLDGLVKDYCLTAPEIGFELRRTTERPNSRGGVIAPGVVAFVTTIGKIEVPEYVTQNGTTFFFKTAWYRTGRFMLRVCVVSGSERHEGDFTIPELRVAIGPIRSRRRWSFGGIIRAIFG